MASRTGRIEELYVTDQTVYVRLDIPAEEAPLKQYFAHGYYTRSGLYSVLLAAAANGRRVTLRTRDPISPTAYAPIVAVQVLFTDA